MAAAQRAAAAADALAREARAREELAHQAGGSPVLIHRCLLSRRVFFFFVDVTDPRLIVCAVTTCHSPDPTPYTRNPFNTGGIKSMLARIAPP